MRVEHISRRPLVYVYCVAAAATDLERAQNNAVAAVAMFSKIKNKNGRTT